MQRKALKMSSRTTTESTVQKKSVVNSYWFSKLMEEINWLWPINGLTTPELSVVGFA